MSKQRWNENFNRARFRSVLYLTIVVVLLCFLSQYFNDEIFLSKAIHLPIAEFRPIRVLRGVHTFYNVCIEDLKPPKLRRAPGHIFNETKKIVVYGESGYANATIINLQVAGCPKSGWNHWDLHFEHKNASFYKKAISDTAFFIQPTHPGNLHHFFVDEFVGLFSVVRLCNRLHPGAKNQILYRTPEVGSANPKSRSRQRYEDVLKTLYINEFHDVFYNLPSNTCFRQAVFGTSFYLHRPRDVIDHVLRYHKVQLRSNTNVTDFFVTIVARDDRRMLNINDVASFAREVGFKNVRIVELSGLSIPEQLRIMSTTNVLIGVNGAGLQWAVFMPEGSCLIELSWPQKYSDFWYNRPEFVSMYGVTWTGVAVHDLRVNWTTFEAVARRGVKISAKERELLIKQPLRDARDNFWKWSDVFVEKREILETLNNTFRRLTKSI